MSIQKGIALHSSGFRAIRAEDRQYGAGTSAIQTSKIHGNPMLEKCVMTSPAGL